MTFRPLAGLPYWLTGLMLALTICWVGLIGYRHVSGMRTTLDRIEAPLADIRLVLVGPRAAPPGIVVVAIDDETVAQAGGYPLPRQTLARLVSAIASGRPRALAVDILLVDATTPEVDLAVASAFREVPTVLAAAGRFGAARGGASAVPRTEGELWPRPPIDRWAEVGLVNIATDGGGTPRHMPLLFQTTRGLAPSFALRAAALGTGEQPVFGADGLRLADHVVPLDLGGHLPLRFYGPRGTIETLSALELLSESGQAARLEGRIVVLGVTATAVGDTFATPFDPVTPGVEVLATGIAQLTGGPGLVRDAEIRQIDAVVTLALALFGVAAVARAPLSLGLGVAAAALAVWLGATVVLFGEGYWLSAVVPLAGVVPPVAAVTVLRQVYDRRRTRDLARAEGALRRFQAPALAARIERDPDFLREPLARDAAIVFLDLSGFTGLSEAMGAGATQAFLGQFQVVVQTVASAHDGLVLNFMGDGAMIVFGVPDEHPEDGPRAVAATFALVTAIRRWIATTDAAAAGMDVRLGAHFGPIVLSRLGHESHQQITTTGDSVNLASRLMEVAKRHGATVAISADLLARAGAERAAPSPDETLEEEVRGRRQPVSVALWRLEREGGAA